MKQTKVERRSSLRIFVVGTEFFRSPGGIQYVNRLLARALADFARGTSARIELLAFNDRAAQKLPEYLEPDLVGWHGFNRDRLRMGRGIARLLYSEKPQLVLFTHVHLLRLAGLVRWLAPHCRVGLLGHSVEVWDPVPAGLRPWVEKADAVVAPSTFTRQRLIEKNGVRPERISVLAHGLDPQFCAAIAAVRDTPRTGQTLLSVTRLVRAHAGKGVQAVLAALPDVAQKCPAVRYLVAGDGDDRPRLAEMARQLGIAHRVEFLGELNEADVGSVYRQADVFVLPSKTEGFGIAFAEAMYAGLPVVARAIGGATDVIEHGRTGILLSSDQPGELAESLIALLGSEEMRQNMGRAGRRRAQENFLFQHFSARWQRWLAEVIPEAIYCSRQAAAFARAHLETPAITESAA